MSYQEIPVLSDFIKFGFLSNGLSNLPEGFFIVIINVLFTTGGLHFVWGNRDDIRGQCFSNNWALDSFGKEVQ